MCRLLWSVMFKILASRCSRVNNRSSQLSDDGQPASTCREPRHSKTKANWSSLLHCYFARISMFSQVGSMRDLDDTRLNGGEMAKPCRAGGLLGVSFGRLSEAFKGFCPPNIPRSANTVVFQPSFPAPSAPRTSCVCP